MRILIVATLFSLASCATTSNTPKLDDRLASWTGSSIHELSAVLGEPTRTSEKWWEWRIRQQSSWRTSSSAPLRPTGTRCPNCDANSAPSGYSVSPGISGGSTSHSGGGGSHYSMCAYRATLDEDSIVSIKAIRVAGRCRFNELPFLTQE